MTKEIGREQVELTEEENDLIEEYEKYCQETEEPVSFAKWFGVWD